MTLIIVEYRQNFIYRSMLLQQTYKLSTSLSELYMKRLLVNQTLIMLID